MTDEHEEMESRADVLLFECTLSAPPEKVWKALTDPALLSAWLMDVDVRPERGASFRLRGDGARAPREVRCEVLESEHPRYLRYRWRDADAEPGDADTVVIFRLTRTAQGGTLLRLTHKGFGAQRDAGGFRCAA